MAKWVIFEGDGSVDAFISRLLERLKLLWTSHMSGYLMEPIRDSEDFKGFVRNVKNCQKQPIWQKRVAFKRGGSLDTLFSMVWWRPIMLWHSHI